MTIYRINKYGILKDGSQLIPKTIGLPAYDEYQEWLKAGNDPEPEFFASLFEAKSYAKKRVAEEAKRRYAALLTKSGYGAEEASSWEGKRQQAETFLEFLNPSDAPDLLIETLARLGVSEDEISKQALIQNMTVLAEKVVTKGLAFRAASARIAGTRKRLQEKIDELTTIEEVERFVPSEHWGSED